MAASTEKTDKKSRTRLDRHERGFTLIELLVVVVLLGIIATVAMPGLSTTDPQQLELATRTVAGAIRHARSEAIRTGEPHGIYADQAGQIIHVYRLDTSVIPATPVYDVYDPLTRQPYSLKFGSAMGGVTMSSHSFKFRGLSAGLSYLGFSGSTGVPKYDFLGATLMLEAANIKLSYHGVQKTIETSPMTGRVTVQ